MFLMVGLNESDLNQILQVLRDWEHIIEAGKIDFEELGL